MTFREKIEKGQIYLSEIARIDIALEKMAIQNMDGGYTTLELTGPRGFTNCVTFIERGASLQVEQYLKSCKDELLTKIEDLENE